MKETNISATRCQYNHYGQYGGAYHLQYPHYKDRQKQTIGIVRENSEIAVAILL